MPSRSDRGDSGAYLQTPSYRCRNPLFWLHWKGNVGSDDLLLLVGLDQSCASTLTRVHTAEFALIPWSKIQGAIFEIVVSGKPHLMGWRGVPF